MNNPDPRTWGTGKPKPTSFDPYPNIPPDQPTLNQRLDTLELTLERIETQTTLLTNAINTLHQQLTQQ